MKYVLTAVAALVVAVFVAPATANAAPATAVTTCGTTVTGTTAYLARNLVCPGNGVTLASAGVVFDLRGHSLIGPGSTSSAVGITLGDNANNAQVRNGSLVHWGTGIDLGYSHVGLKLSGLNFSVSATGVYANIGNAVTIDKSTFGILRSGVAGTLSDTTVTNSTFKGNRAAGSIAFSLAADHIGIIENTKISDYATGIDCTDDSCTVKNSTLENNGVGALVDSEGGITMSGSVVRNNTIGISARGGFYTFLDVTCTRFIDNHVGVALYGNDFATEKVTNSRFVGNGYGIYSLGAEQIQPAQIVLTGNLLLANTNGIYLTDKSAQTQVGSNLAVRNKHWGIYSVGPVTDLGGNRAAANGTGQCKGVVCTTAFA